MKFAKKLQEDMRQDWTDNYIDYKMMKKVLKKSDDEVISFFCEAFESQVLKVHNFMAGRQEQINADISPLETSGTLQECSTISVKTQSLSSHCEQLVQDIEVFKDFAALNLTAIRKIIKKFDKRFHVHFQDIFDNPTRSTLSVSDSDIGKWLLFPAQQCLKLIHMLPQPAKPVERPLRQYCFWVAELRAGSEIARQQVSCEGSVDHTSLRLLLLSGETPKDLTLCVKNTFIDDTVRSPAARRSSSEPRHVVKKERLLDDTADAAHAGADAGLDLSQTKKQQAEETDNPDESADERSATGEDVRAFDVEKRKVQMIHLDDLVRGDAAMDTSMSNHQAALIAPTPMRPPGLVQQKRRQPAKQGSYGGPSRMQDAGAEFSSSQTRWWTLSRENCPVSGFPISLLPYPPYKFYHCNGSVKGQPQLVDGAYLVLHVISTWSFEILGRALNSSDIESLDTYMARCKLGPLRLGKAIAIYSSGTKEAHIELKQLRQQSRCKMNKLRHIQRVRRNKGCLN